jgi:hypothetical protein
MRIILQRFAVLAGGLIPPPNVRSCEAAITVELASALRDYDACAQDVPCFASQSWCAAIDLRQVFCWV